MRNILHGAVTLRSCRFQHPGKGGTLSNYLGADRDEVLENLNSKRNNLKKSAIGYIGNEDGALPGIK